MREDGLEKIKERKARYGLGMNRGLTGEELAAFSGNVEAAFGILLPEGYRKLLLRANGWEYNGYKLYGADFYGKPFSGAGAAGETDENGLVWNNEIWWENEWQKAYLFLGEGDMSWFVCRIGDGRFLELDLPSGSPVAAFDSFEGLYEQMLKEALM